jgi:hypothetical protein
LPPSRTQPGADERKNSHDSHVTHPYPAALASNFSEISAIERRFLSLVASRVLAHRASRGDAAAALRDE